MTLLTPFYEREGIRIYVGDNREVLPHIAPVHAVVTDPPYGLTSGNAVYDLAKTGAGNPRVRRSTQGGGFMGKKWDGTGIERDPEMWEMVKAAMLPGAHLLAFGGTRTYHRMAVAIEDAGYEIRDTLQWLYGSGFPKSHDVSKAIDKMAGAERERVELVGGALNSGTANGWNNGGNHSPTAPLAGTRQVDTPATPAAEQWQGWGTALKPAYEPIIMARSPFKGTVAQNVLAHGTGAINIDASRVGVDADDPNHRRPSVPFDGADGVGYSGGLGGRPTENLPTAGRWPANVILDEDAAEALDAQSGERKSGAIRAGRANGTNFQQSHARVAKYDVPANTGGASRYFYVAKASRRERNAGLEGMPERESGAPMNTRCVTCGRLKLAPTQSQCKCVVHIPADRVSRNGVQNHHPTVKPIALMRYLIQMVTPPEGIVLDPFMGSGSTLVAAAELGFNAIGIELSEEYAEIAARRVDHALNERAKRLPGLEVAD